MLDSPGADAGRDLTALSVVGATWRGFDRLFNARKADAEG
jgi:hypothetical protein